MLAHGGLPFPEDIDPKGLSLSETWYQGTEHLGSGRGLFQKSNCLTLNRTALLCLGKNFFLKFFCYYFFFSSFLIQKLLFSGVKMHISCYQDFIFNLEPGINQWSVPCYK